MPDYDGAEEHLEKGRYNGVITDLFFPKKIGSNDVSLGQRIVTEIELMGQQPDFRDKVGGSIASDFDRDIVNLKKAVAMQEFEIAPGSKMKQDIGANEEERTIMPPSAQNQPLGVLVAEKAKERNIPYAIVTSGHGAHGDISTPVAVYLQEKGLVKSIRGTRAGQKPREGGLCDYVRKGQFISFEDYEANKLANSEYYRKHPERIREDYDDRRDYFESTTSQPFFVDAEKHKPDVWEDVFKWMEYVVNKGAERNSPAQ